MEEFSTESARAAIDGLALGDGNLAVARYWLSLCRDGRLPSYQSFDFTRVQTHRSAIAIFDVRPEGVTMCESAGALFAAWLGFDLAGIDIISITPAIERDKRYANMLRILAGSASYSERRFLMRDGRDEWVPEIGLPFQSRKPGEARRILFHIAFPPLGSWLPADLRHDTAIGPRFRIVSLMRPTSIEDEIARRVGVR